MEFWDNVIQGRSSIVEVPTSRAGLASILDEDKSVPDKTYAKIGGFLQDFKFDSKRFRIPPKVAGQVAIVQQIALSAVAEALDDAGYKALAKDDGKDFDRSRCAVILGNSMGGEVTDDYVCGRGHLLFLQALRVVPGFAALPAAQQEEIILGFEKAVKADLPPINEDSMPGELSNVIAGRIPMRST